MSVYEFIDHLVDVNADDIYVDEDYRKLLDICQKYCVYFSYIYHDEVQNIVELQPFIYKEFYTYHWPGTGKTNYGGIYRIYYCNRESIGILKKKNQGFIRVH